MQMKLGSAIRPGEGASEMPVDVVAGGWACVEPETVIDDLGGYGQMEDQRPDFVKEAERGWTFLGSLAEKFGR